MQKIPYIVTAVTIILAALFAILNRFWADFVYFTFSCLLLLALFWGAWQILQYFTTFKVELQERFKLYKAQKVNSGVVTKEDFEKNLTAYEKDFKKRVLKDKFVKWFVIMFCFAVAAAYVIAMILQ